MDLNKIKAGEKIPEEFNVIIEIPAYEGKVKYEFDKDVGAVFVDRFSKTSMYYPSNYGFIPHTLSDDGDPCDVLVLTSYPLVVGSVIKSRPVGVLSMTDESGEDEKILAVPVSKLDRSFDHITDIHHVDNNIKQSIVHFFKHYKELDENKWVNIKGWQDITSARKLINQAVDRAKK